jgi:hypothetical protein
VLHYTIIPECLFVTLIKAARHTHTHTHTHISTLYSTYWTASRTRGSYETFSTARTLTHALLSIFYSENLKVLFTWFTQKRPLLRTSRVQFCVWAGGVALKRMFVNSCILSLCSYGSCRSFLVYWVLLTYKLFFFFISEEKRGIH